MNYFYQPDLDQYPIIVGGDEYRHGIRSMRKKVGDLIYLVDGKGALATAQIQQLDKGYAECVLLEKEKNHHPLPYQLHLCVAPTKNTNRWEWLLEKCTEIGCSQFIPILCEHSERRNLRIDRSERVLIAAMKQSLKAYLPRLERLTPYTEVLSSAKAEKKIICTSGAKTHFLDEYQGETSVQILIGPEGDFSPAEVELAQEFDFQLAHLGPQRLRTETAAVVATTLIANASKY